MAIAIYMIVLVYSLLLGGFIVKQSELPKALQWAMYTSYFWYGFGSLCVNEFELKSYGRSVLKSMEMDQIQKNYYLAILVSMWLLFQLWAFLLLKFVNREKR